MSELVPVFPASDNAPLAPYTPAIKVNGFVYCSGQIGMVDGKLSGDFKTECVAALDRVKNLVEAAGKWCDLMQTKSTNAQSLFLLVSINFCEGSNMSKVVKVTIFLAGSMEHYETLSAVYADYFAKPYPARSCVAVAALPRGNFSLFTNLFHILSPLNTHFHSPSMKKNIIHIITSDTLCIPTIAHLDFSESRTPSLWL